VNVKSPRTRFTSPSIDKSDDNKRSLNFFPESLRSSTSRKHKQANKKEHDQRNKTKKKKRMTELGITHIILILLRN
jgi:hypothetical protein